jgi:hypothetical protein
MTFLMAVKTLYTIGKALVRGRRNLAKADKATDAYRDKLKAEIIKRGETT